MVAVDAGLCGSSLHVWYKALSQELLHQWAAHAASVVALHKSRQGPLQQEAVDAALEQLKQCGKAFSSLLMLNKTHLKRIQVGVAHVNFKTCAVSQLHCITELFWQHTLQCASMAMHRIAVHGPLPRRLPLPCTVIK